VIRIFIPNLAQAVVMVLGALLFRFVSMRSMIGFLVGGYCGCVAGNLSNHFKKRKEPTYLIDGNAIQCLICRRVSFHPMDVEHKYCGYCHIFHQR
jgi:uncharacterized membrane protein